MKLKGDVAAEAADGETYTFRYSGAALMAIEESFGAPFATVFRDLAAKSEEGRSTISDAAKLIHAGLRRYHPSLSLDDAADLALDEAIRNAMSEAVALAFPQDAEGGDDAPARPPKRGAGTRS